MSVSEPFRSAAPLAAAGIVCLGLVPLLGGPERPLHWAVTAGMAGFGVLLWARRRLRGPEAALQRVPPEAVRTAGRALLVVVAVVAVLVGVIVGYRVFSGEPLSPLSLVLPAAGLAWLALLGFQVLRHREAGLDGASTDERPSRRPPNWDSLSNRQSSHPGPPDRHVSA